MTTIEEIDVDADKTAPSLKISNVCKSFGSAKVLADLNLEVRSGEFVGLMGPNGAGKSTLVKILDGVYSATSGTIELGGKPVANIGGQAEVGFIHQDLGLVDDLSVSENLRLGEPPIRLLGPILDHHGENKSAAKSLAAIGLTVPVSTKVGELSPGEKTLVAIARLFSKGARLLFVDEATSTLAPRDAAKVIETLKSMVAQGATVVMVSHKLGEILEATDRVVLLLDGRIAADKPTNGLGRAGLVRLLAQHEHDVVESADSTDHRDDNGPGEVVLTLRDAVWQHVGPVNLELRAGHVLGITGLPGSGLHDVAYLAHGSLRPDSGTRMVRDHARSALVPPHRETQGGFAAMSLRENSTISSLRRWVRALGILDTKREKTDSQDMIASLEVVPGRADAEFGVLSGGNKQKVIFARALFTQADIYVLCEPTRGVDIAARADIYRLVHQLRSEGAAVLVVTSDAEDLFALCDHVSVITDGAISEPRRLNGQSADLMEEIL